MSTSPATTSSPTLPTDYAGLMQHAAGLAAERKWAEAAQIYRALLAATPGNGVLLGNLGMCFLRLGEFRLAAAYLEAAAVLRPTPDIHTLRGNAWLELREYGIAEACYRLTLQTHPDHMEALAGIGNSYFRRCLWAEALPYYEQVHERIADKHTTLPTLTECHAKLLHLEEAAALYRECIALKPDEPGHYIKLARIYQEMDDMDKAAAVYAEARKQLGDYPDIMYAYGFFLLHNGDWEEGFAWYEKRWETTSLGRRYARTTDPLKGARWDGKASLEGKTVMAMTEQGAGDLFQFVRYCKHLKEAGATVDILAPPHMKSILETVPWIRAVHTRYEQIPEFDYYVPLMSCPLLFNTTPETIPGGVPYLFAPKKCERFSEKPTIGLVWAGDQNFEHDHHRSASFDLYKPLIEQFPDYAFVSLQLGEKGQEAREWIEKGLVIDGTAGLRDYGDTAAALMVLDLLITTCTSIVHLSGAMDKPAWLLLSACPDWRWGDSGAKSPWYPSLRLYRQKKLGDWAPVMKAIVKDLAK